ncbi:MAG: hypothetical protein L6Q98_24120 [Anaerolineae bacterium]|nr:hypothetical protein [Anaerolineae bacterium]NUQ07327.1 hypothetical protein [Anaerolineae bacterium]
MFVVADYASIEPATGKLNVLGVFTSITAASFPAVHRRMAVIARITADNPTETTDPRKFELLLTDADGTDHLKFSGMIALPRDAQGNRLDQNVLVELNNVEFPHSGVYEFAIYVDGHRIGDTPIELKQL